MSLEEQNFIVRNEPNSLASGRMAIVTMIRIMKSKPIDQEQSNVKVSQPIIMGADAQTLGGYPRILKSQSRSPFAWSTRPTTTNKWSVSKKQYFEP